MSAYKQVMLLEHGEWVECSFDTYNICKKHKIMGGITAAMVLKKLKPFESEFNLKMADDLRGINYVSVIGLDVQNTIFPSPSYFPRPIHPQFRFTSQNYLY